MKLLILLVAACVSLSVQAQVADTSWVNDLKYPKLTIASADSSKWIIRVHDNKIEIKGDTMAAILGLWRRIQELSGEKSDFQTLFVRGYEFINQVPDYLKDSMNFAWSRYVIELRKQGWKIPIKN